MSASQISTWLDCPRKWAYSRVRPRVDSPYTLFGKRAHAHAEAWLRDAEPPPLGEPEGACIAAGLHHLPLPKTPGMLVEHSFEFEVDEVRYVGIVDFLYGQDGDTVVIGDHKTKGNLTFCLRPDQLLEDPQRIVYAAWATAAFGCNYSAALWVYYQRRPPATDTTCVVESREDTLARFRDLHQRAGLPIIQSDGIPPEDLPAKRSACGKFGGCPYANECPA